MALVERTDELTVASALAARATTDPAQSWLLFGDETLGFGEIDQQAEALAASLANLGVGRGDRIALLLPACPEFAISMFAAAKLGSVVVPLNPRLTTPELQYMLRHSQALCAVTIERHRGVDYLHLFEDVMPQLPELRYLVTVGEEDLWYDDRIFQFEDLLSAGAGRDYPAAEVTASDCFALVYTSGTSGKPKGVELSHRNLLAAAGGTAAALGLGGDDRLVGFSALFHVHGLGPGLLGSLLAGSSIILQDESDAAGTLDAAERHAATVHFGIPTHFVAELAELEAQPRELGALRLAVVSGAPVSDGLVNEIARALDVPVVSGYSLTEAASTVSVCSPDDPPEARRFTVGRPIGGSEVRIVDADAAAGDELPVESVGEIRVKGPGVMLGYYRQPRQTA